MSGLFGIVLGVIASSIAGWWMQHRLEAFGDILTVAVAHRRKESMTPQSLES
jgi:hypothetical protein